MTTYRYNDGRRCGGRKPRLYLARGAQIAKFDGRGIDGFCAIAQESYEKRGKWSNTTYTLLLAPGVRPIFLLSPLHGTWGDGLESWGQVASQLGLPVEVAQEIVRREYPKTARRLDEIERFVAAADAQNCDTEIVVVSFGRPTRREMSTGYWEQPKVAFASDDRLVAVQPGPTGWDSAVATEPEGARVVGTRHTPGIHGGYWAIEVAVPIQG